MKSTLITMTTSNRKNEPTTENDDTVNIWCHQSNVDNIHPSHSMKYQRQQTEAIEQKIAKQGQK